MAGGALCHGTFGTMVNPALAGYAIENIAEFIW